MWSTVPPAHPTGSRFLAFDPSGRIHLPLTLFAREASRRLSASTARAYIAALRPFFLDVLQDANVWDQAPELVRRQVADYVRGRLRCKVRPHRLGIEVVTLTDGSATGVRIFLSAAKLFYRVMHEAKLYPDQNRLVQVTVADKPDADDFLALMPERSGVSPPRQRRLSDNYFRLEGGDWVPRVIDDSRFPALILMAGSRVSGWGLRETSDPSLWAGRPDPPGASPRRPHRQRTTSIRRFGPGASLLCPDLVEPSAVRIKLVTLTAFPGRTHFRSGNVPVWPDPPRDFTQVRP